jgi:hypothetical protein
MPKSTGVENMKILFDLLSTQPSGSSRYHGGSEYGKAIYNEIIIKSNELTNVKMDAFYDYSLPIDVDINILSDSYNISRTNKNYIDINRLLLDGKYDIFYSCLPINYCNIHVPDETKFVATLHGVRLIHDIHLGLDLFYAHSTITQLIKCILKHFTPWKFILKRMRNKYINILSFSKSPIILTVSNYSKQTYQYILHDYITLDNFNVCYSPVKLKNNFSHNQMIDLNFIQSLGLENKKYFLLTMGDRLEKNAFTAILALDRFFSMNTQESNGFRCLLVGATGKFSDLYKKHIHNIGKFVILNKYLSAYEMKMAYENAYLFLYPTLGEGFGYPPLEAMELGTLVACSANSSIIEVCGNAPLYFNALDIDEIIIRVIQSFDISIVKEKYVLLKERTKYIREKQNNSLENTLNLILQKK